MQHFYHVQQPHSVQFWRQKVHPFPPLTTAILFPFRKRTASHDNPMTTYNFWNTSLRYTLLYFSRPARILSILINHGRQRDCGFRHPSISHTCFTRCPFYFADYLASKSTGDSRGRHAEVRLGITLSLYVTWFVLGRRERALHPLWIADLGHSTTVVVLIVSIVSLSIDAGKTKAALWGVVLRLSFTVSP